MTRPARLVTCRVLVALSLFAGCSTEEVFVMPTPSWERMIVQPKVDPYEPGSMRHAPPGTVPFSVEPVEPAIRPELDWALLMRGQRRFGTFCEPCHGPLGTGNTPVAANMQLAAPANLQSARLRAVSDAHLYRVTREGYGLMPAYAAELSPADTWAVVAWVRTLQLSQHVEIEGLSPGWRDQALRELEPGGAR